MTFELEFDPRAWKEWKKLGDTVRQQFKKKLSEVIERPRIEANRLNGMPDCYKIKLRGAGIGWFIRYRMIGWWYSWSQWGGANGKRCIWMQCRVLISESL
ncbi:type II toxin-antitoxin system RelE family toxin [Aeromonas sp. 2692-1]|uniref:type II toxin-antitoxin system RelE family toxin n=1 Tax=Aeromonas sp. 2692-1 TaxID=2560029 RepID=UPI00403F357B